MARTTRKTRRPQVVAGPILYFRGQQGDRWRLSALFVLDGDAEPDDLTIDGVLLPSPPRHLHASNGRALWRYDFAIPRRPTDHRAGYGFAGADRWYLTVPASGRPPRLAYVAGNRAGDTGGGGEREALWVRLNGAHRAAPFDLFLQGGGQVGADGVWRGVPALASWLERPPHERLTQPFTQAMADAADAWLLELYCRAWRQPEVAAIAASLPSLLVWDDHDVGDRGLGGAGLRHCPVATSVLAAARRHAMLFQLGAAADDPPDHACGAGSATIAQSVVVDGIGILALNLWTERTADRMLGERTWAALPEWLARFEGCRDLLVLSGAPLAFPDRHGLARTVARLAGATGADDDLADLWLDRPRRPEWRRLVGLLHGLSARAGVRVTVVSGHASLGAAGILSGGGATLWQIVVPAIAQAAPGAFALAALERSARGAQQLADGLVLEMLAFPGTDRRFLRAGSLLAIEPSSDGALRVLWHAAGETPPLERVVHPQGER